MELFSFEGIVADIIAKSRQTGEKQTNLLSLLGLKQVNENETSEPSEFKNMIKLPFKFFYSQVSLTLRINLYFRISPRIFVKIRNGPHGTLGTLRGPGETDC